MIASRHPSTNVAEAVSGFTSAREMMVMYQDLANSDWSCVKRLGIDRPRSNFAGDIAESFDNVSELITDHLAALNMIGAQLLAERKADTLPDTDYAGLSQWHHAEQERLQRHWDRFSRKRDHVVQGPAVS